MAFGFTHIGSSKSSGIKENILLPNPIVKSQKENKNKIKAQKASKVDAQATLMPKGQTTPLLDVQTIILTSKPCNPLAQR